MSDERVYCIQNQEGRHFTTGILPSGEQLFLGAEKKRSESFKDYLIVVRFGPDGSFLGLDERPMARTKPAITAELLAQNPGKTEDELHTRIVNLTLAAMRTEPIRVRDELGAALGTIRVKQFDLSAFGYGVGIEPYPEDLRQIREDPDGIADEESRAELQEDLNAWEASGEFVLWWQSTDYHVDAEGKIVSS
jgi:hypothetical protein